jgi:hypothetical protein
MCIECGCQNTEESQRESSNAVTSNSIKGNSN